MSAATPELIVTGLRRPWLTRTGVINTIIDLAYQDRECSYLEVGVRDPSQNFDKIKAKTKAGVDPQTEQEAMGHRVTWKMTSDEFFATHDEKWDIVFIDGLHLAPQTHSDINGALAHLNPGGFIVLHDCNPPNWWNAHSDYEYFLQNPHEWNGSVWKAWYVARLTLRYPTVCVDTDEGCGVISTRKELDKPVIQMTNPFLEYGQMIKDRKGQLGLVSPDEFLSRFQELL